MHYEFILSYYKQLGDLVLTQPLLTRLSDQSGSKVGVICRPKFAPLIQLMKGDLDLIRLGGPWISCNKLVCADLGSRAASRSVFVRSKEKFALCRKREKLGTWHKIGGFRHLIPAGPDMYRAHWLEKSITGTVNDPDMGPGLIKPPLDWHKSMFEGADVILHLTAAWKRKYWPNEHWVKLIHLLKVNGFRKILISGGASECEQSVVKEVVGMARSREVSSVGELNLKQFIALMSLDVPVITVDGAAAHLGRAFGNKVLVLFGETNARQWHLPSPQSIALCSEDKRMESLLPEGVADSFLKMAGTS